MLLKDAFLGEGGDLGEDMVSDEKLAASPGLGRSWVGPKSEEESRRAGDMGEASLCLAPSASEAHFEKRRLERALPQFQMELNMSMTLSPSRPMKKAITSRFD